MSSMGADLEQLAQLQRTLAQQAEVLAGVSRAVGAQLADTSWHGPAADRFRDAWSGEFEPALRRMHVALQDAGAEVARRRDALRQAGG